LHPWLIDRGLDLKTTANELLKGIFEVTPRGDGAVQLATISSRVAD
jgi:hypothetical protein